MTIHRAVPDLTSDDLDASRALYRDLLGFEVAMDLGWVVNFVSPSNPAAQVIVVDGADRTAPVPPDLSVEVDDVDAIHDRARAIGYEIVHPLTDEEWGVRRFFLRDPSTGKVVNVLSHQGATSA